MTVAVDKPGDHGVFRAEFVNDFHGGLAVVRVDEFDGLASEEFVYLIAEFLFPLRIEPQKTALHVGDAEEVDAGVEVAGELLLHFHFVRDVRKNGGKARSFRFECAYVIASVQCPGAPPVHVSGTGLDDFVIQFDPIGFRFGQDLQNCPADDLFRFQAGQPFKGGIDFNEPVIVCFSVRVIEHFMKGESAHHVFKQQTVFLLASAQLGSPFAHQLFQFRPPPQDQKRDDRDRRREAQTRQEREPPSADGIRAQERPGRPDRDQKDFPEEKQGTHDRIRRGAVVVHSEGRQNFGGGIRMDGGKRYLLHVVFPVGKSQQGFQRDGRGGEPPRLVGRRLVDDGRKDYNASLFPCFGILNQRNGLACDRQLRADCGLNGVQQPGFRSQVESAEVVAFEFRDVIKNRIIRRPSGGRNRLLIVSELPDMETGKTFLPDPGFKMIPVFFRNDRDPAPGVNQ
ncbi:MAG: hypothetical protein BWY31_02489 [Lentisphaerae bacterium ADurb.Bin242]|nr:MAG: hypothetical protein BWY31_02489 [Lentisphaerae bacterium ADurb.Bin242]